MADFEIDDPRFLACVLPNAPPLILGEGFGWLEGPVWFADHECLLVSDIPNDRILRWTESGGVSVFRQPSGFANGHARDRQGRLIGCSHQHRCVTRTELDGRVTVLVDRFEGKRLNSPNDVVCKSDGSTWFSDPHYGISTDYEGGKQTPELPPTLYRLDPADGRLAIVADEFAGPNGLAFSPDESLLYASETGAQFAADPERCIRVFDVTNDGTRLANSRVFHTIAPGFPTAFASIRKAGSGPPPATACIASRQTGCGSGESRRRSRSRTSRSGPQPRSAVPLRVAHSVRNLYQRARRGMALTIPPAAVARWRAPAPCRGRARRRTLSKQANRDWKLAPTTTASRRQRPPTIRPSSDGRVLNKASARPLNRRQPRLDEARLASLGTRQERKRTRRRSRRFPVLLGF